jgi:cytochrome c oxidase assembly factor CtaG/putative copper export protein
MGSPTTPRQASSFAREPKRLVPERMPGGPRLLWSGVAVAVLVVGAVVLGQTWRAAANGLPDAGRLVVDGLPLLRLAMLLSGGVVLGFATSAVALDPTAAAAGSPRGSITVLGRTDLRVAVAGAIAMSVTSVLVALFTLADVLGLPLGQVLQPGIVSTYLWEVEASRAALLSGVLALLVAVGLTLSRTLGGAAGWLLVALVAVGVPSLTGHAAGLGSHTLALVAGFVHATVAMLWSGGVVALATHAVLRTPSLGERVRRFGVVAVGSVALLALSGIGAASTRLDSWSQLTGTTYGRMLLIKAGLLGTALLLALTVRRRVRGGGVPGARVLAEVAVLGATLGVAVLLARTAFPRASVELPSAGEEIIGYAYPPAPTISRVALGWHPDWVWLTVAAIAIGAYVAGVLVLRRRGDSWPVGRLGAWVLGWLVIVWATCSGVAWYAPVSFSLHMLSHMALSMFAPVLLVLGGPVTLALRAIPPASSGQRGPREWITWALHTPVTRFLTHPAYVLFVYTVGLYGLYYTDLYADLMRSHLGHLAMQVHFLVAGYLFFWVVVGVDPAPRRLPYSARLLLLLASLVIHSFFAVPMMMTETPMVAEWYALVRPPWLTDPVADTNMAGGLAWGLGELPTLVVAIALGIQWARSDEAEARRSDRRADRDGDAELVAYNARLAALHEADVRAQAPRPASGPDFDG